MQISIEQSSETSQQVQQLIKVPQGKKCYQCGSQLGQFYYWCYWSCPQDLRCRCCVQATNQRGFFIYEQNVILIHKTTKSVLKNRLGYNIQPQKQQGAYFSDDYNCNICQQCPQQRIPRYISLGSRNQEEIQQQGYDDLCEPCMIRYINNNKGIRAQIRSENHAFLRILYGGKEYRYQIY